MKLVDNWKDAWRWFSMWFLGFAAAAQVAWETLPPEAIAVVPEQWRGYITIGLLVAAAIGRVIDQSKPKPLQ
jgi:hypothetical protein